MKHWISVTILGWDYEKSLSISDQSDLILLELLRFPKFKWKLLFIIVEKKPNSTKRGCKHLLNGHTHLKVERCYTNTIYFSEMVLSWDTHLWVLQILSKIQSTFFKVLCSKKHHGRALRSEYLPNYCKQGRVCLLCFSMLLTVSQQSPSTFSYTITNSQGEGSTPPSTNPWQCKAPALATTLQLTAVSTNELKQTVVRSWSYL